MVWRLCLAFVVIKNLVFSYETLRRTHSKLIGMNSHKELVGVADIRTHFNLGRDLATELVRLLPHVTLGRSGRGEKRLVRRTDFDLLISKAMSEERDLWELVRDFTPERLRRWLGSEALN